ncbi:hypothetical protein F5Y04DRAFT_247813 [Hypomontagnella monticulosa]|nr:hypothetical protein F5Y04DRAFT_247813 [Hypomontagnella monticulosa]
MAAPGFAEGSPSHTTKLRALPDDLFYYIAKDLLSAPEDISRLSLTCRRLYMLLHPLVYRADVLKTKHDVFSPSLKYKRYRSPNPNGLRKEINETFRKTILQWATSQTDTNLGLTVARRSIEAAVSHWPGYLRTFYGGFSLIQYAAIYGHHVVVQELIEAGVPVDELAYVRNRDKRGPGRPPKVARLNFPDGTSPRKQNHHHQHEIPLFLPRDFGLMLNTLGLAIVYRNIRVAEILARNTQKIVEGPFENRRRQVTLPMRLAALYKMPSVIEILQARGYKETFIGNYHFHGASALQFAATVEYNEEVLQLLLDAGSDVGDVDGRQLDAFFYACAYDCVSNAIFLAGKYRPENKPAYVTNHIKKLTKANKLRPITKYRLNPDTGTRKRISIMICDIEDFYSPGLIRHLLKCAGVRSGSWGHWQAVFTKRPHIGNIYDYDSDSSDSSDSYDSDDDSDDYGYD